MQQERKKEMLEFNTISEKKNDNKFLIVAKKKSEGYCCQLEHVT